MYKTILTYGGTWMAENLDYGTMVPGSSSQSTVGTVEKYCYNDDPANCVKYGALYQWAESMNLESSCNAATCASLVGANHQGLCPTGWHVPTDQDWNSIYSPSGTDITYGAALKSGVDEWGNYGTNASGFSAVPGGYRKVDGTFLDQNVKAFLWSASEPSSALYTGSLYLGQSDGVAVSSSLKTKGYSLRCKQN